MKINEEKVSMYTIVLTKEEMTDLQNLLQNGYEKDIEENFCAEMLDIIEDIKPAGGF
jgi:broad-specificity NMP kinase